MAFMSSGKNAVGRISMRHPLLHAIQGLRYKRKLEVILTTSIDKLGKAGETVKVAPGYFRNCLMPKMLALPNIDKFRYLVDEQRKIYPPEEEEEVEIVSRTGESGIKAYETAANRLCSNKLTIRKFIIEGKGEELREPVTKEEIISEVARQLQLRIEPENLHLPSPLSNLGEHKVQLRLPKTIPKPTGMEWILNLKIRKR